MKSVCTLALCLSITASSFAQGKEKQSDRNRPEETQNQKREDEKNDERVNEHEKVIWAGTGINLNEKSKEVKSIPDKVLASFRQFFPNQSIDNVRKYHGLYAITFSNPTYTTTLIYKADGTFVEAITVATDSILPSQVKEKLREAKTDYYKNDLVLIERADKRKFYRVHLKRDKNNQFVVYNEEGKEVNYDY